MNAPKPQLCLRTDCHHHAEQTWTRPAPTPAPMYGAALRIAARPAA